MPGKYKEFNEYQKKSKKIADEFESCETRDGKIKAVDQMIEILQERAEAEKERLLKFIIEDKNDTEKAALILVSIEALNKMHEGIGGIKETRKQFDKL
jgi:hypothetical protein